jgi:oligopeptidase A
MDSTQANPLINPPALQAFDAIRPEHVAPAIRHLLEQARQAVAQVTAKQQPLTWDARVAPLDDATEALSRAWSAVGHLNAVVNTPELRDAYNAMLPEVSAFWTELGLNRALFDSWKALLTQGSQDLSPIRRRILELALRDFRLGGVELEGTAREQWAQLATRHAELTQKFSENVLDATDAWKREVHDASELDGLPEDAMAAARALAQAEAKEGWLLTLKAPCYLPVMQYANNRALRAEVYRAYATRASELGPTEYDNSALITDILGVRQTQAGLLDFPSYAHRQLSTRMASSPAEVIDFLRQLAARARPHAERDMAELREFAARELGLSELEPWDVAYASEKLRQARYSYSEQTVRQYFTEPRVLQGLFGVVRQLFGVVLEPVSAAVWHADARCLAVRSASGTVLGHLYLDLYARSGKQGGAWVDMDRSRRLRLGKLHTPVGFLTCNFAPPTGDKPSTLTHDDVITLYHEMGHALHLLLSEVDELGASPFASVEWDAVELPSQFMENFCWEWPVVSAMSSHVDTGEPLPRELFDRMVAARNFQSGLMTLRQIEFALFDMELHLKPAPNGIEAVLSELARVRREIAVIIPPAWHRLPHSFTHIFAGGYAAGYYSYKWAEVLSADAYEAFEENADPERGTLDAATGERFRREILAVGGARTALESFVAFRGRPPRLDALLRHHGMSEDTPKAA